MKILFVINPKSGTKKKEDWEAQIREYFKTSEHTMEFYLLTGKNDATSVAHHIETVKPDRVVSVGGDGTVKMVGELLQGTDIPLGIIPAGSANGMARELEIPVSLPEALTIAIEGKPRKIDAIRINGKEICIHLSDMGLNAMLVKYFEGSGSRGMWGYGRALLRVLWWKQKMYATITTDGGTVKRKAFMVVLANARKYGTGGNINPEGSIEDGFLEVVVLRRLNLVELLKALMTDRAFDPEKIEVIKTKRAHIHTLRRHYFQVDGEYKGRVREVRAEILPGALYIVMPEGRMRDE
ncbi:MAG TPA: diacylglycerol kinase family protein [Chitinophagaceae bacterium]